MNSSSYNHNLRNLPWTWFGRSDQLRVTPKPWVWRESVIRAKGIMTMVWNFLRDLIQIVWSFVPIMTFILDKMYVQNYLQNVQGLDLVWDFWSQLKNYPLLSWVRIHLWLRIHMPMKGTWVLSLVWEDSTCLGQLNPCGAVTEGSVP